MGFYKVTCPRGHVGNGKETEIAFYFKAKDIMQALSIARKMPSVKHHKAIGFNAIAITPEEYYKKIKVSAYERTPL